MLLALDTAAVRWNRARQSRRAGDGQSISVGRRLTRASNLTERDQVRMPLLAGV